MIFYKTVSAGNDFLHIQRDMYPTLENKKEKSRLVRQLCARHDGAGADGVVFYKAPPPAGGVSEYPPIEPVKFEIFNRDGRQAELSGNGMAGLTALLFHLDMEKNNGHRPRTEAVVLNTRSGQKLNRYISHRGTVFRLKIEIGVPDFHQQEFFPFLENGRQEYSFEDMAFYPVSVGNPHAVVILDMHLPDSRLREMGKKLECADIFPFNTNVELVVPTGGGIRDANFGAGENFKVYYYERGVGPTLASSTGSAAVYSVLRKLNLTENQLILPSPDYGNEIRISGKQKVYIENSTKIVYKGVYLSD
jgi:diaminopimelate epimerase